MVLPQVSDENIVSMYEGGLNLFWAERFGREIGLPDLWVKQCGNSPHRLVQGPRHDRAGERREGDARPGPADPGGGVRVDRRHLGRLAAYCAAASIPAIVLLPREKVSPAQLIQPIANGAIVLSLDTDFDGCMATIQEITETENVYLANSMNSLRIEGQKTVGMEICQQFDWSVPDTIVIPGGNLGNVSALGRDSS
jgi:threonine synthase